MPLDFLSWHCYAAAPDELIDRARAIRTLLDSEGFSQTESHLNEWNYLPGNSWDAFSKTAPPAARREFYSRSQGAEGAAFIVATLLKLQDAPVNIANFFHGEIGGFGLFDEFGAETHAFWAFKVFNELLQNTPTRLRAVGENHSGIAIAAGRNGKNNMVTVLLSNPTSQPHEVQLLIQEHRAGLRSGQLEAFSSKGRQKSSVQVGALGLPIRLEAHTFSTLHVRN